MMQRLAGAIGAASLTLLVGCGGGDVEGPLAELHASDSYKTVTRAHEGQKYLVGLKYKANTGPAALLISRKSGPPFSGDKADRKLASEVGFSYFSEKKCEMGFRVVAAKLAWDDMDFSWRMNSNIVFDKAFYDGKLPDC